MSIRLHLIVLVLFCAFGGVALGIFLIDRQYEANNNSVLLAEAHQHQHDVQRLEDQIKTLFISTDLLFGSGETYMLTASKTQGSNALDLSLMLSKHFQSHGGAITQALFEVQSNLQQLMQEIDKLEKAANRSVFVIDDDQLDRVDADTIALVDEMQLIQEIVQASLVEEELRYKKGNSQFDFLAWGAVSAYLVSLLASLWFAARVVSRPLAKLSRSASDALAGGAKFAVLPEGPAEVRSLVSNFAQLIDSLEFNNAKNHALIEAIPDTLFVVHRDHRLVHVKLGIGASSHILSEKPDWPMMRDLLGKDQAVLVNQMVNNCLETKVQQQLELNVQVNEEHFRLEARASSLDHDEVVVVLRDRTEKFVAEERIRHMAYHDSLTGLLNRRAFKDKLGSHFENRKNEPLAMFYIDVDRFKSINDTHGHEAGDSVLKHVTNCLAECLRPGDNVGRFSREIEAKSARIGGDEFVLILPGIVDETAAESVAARLQSAVMTPFITGRTKISVSASIGISLYPKHGVNVESLMHHADLAMFQAKRSGGEGACVYSENLGDQSRRKLTLEAKLKAAIEQNDLFLVYQPKINLSSRQIVGAEALVRWRDGDTIIPPNEFIPISEDTGLIVPLGKFVAETAIKQMVEWREKGIRMGTMAINVSAAQLKQEGYSEAMLAMVANHGLPPSALNLEITESLLLGDYEAAVEVLRQLQGEGFSIAMDDFGTGYSSLSYLKDLPLNVLKIDRAFVSGISESATERAIIAAILQLGKTLGLRLVAEGVETDEHARFLSENGCDEAQGYLFSPPVSAEEFERLVEISNSTGSFDLAIRA